VSKRKQEATRRNAERKAAAGRRKPPGYKPSSRRTRSFGGRRVFGVVGALVAVAAIGVVLFATNVFGSDKTAGMKTLIKNGTCVETDFKKSMGRAHTTDPKTKIVYTQSDPPTSGKHYQTPPPLMIYDEPVPQWILLHALEHGNVLVQYGNRVSAADRAKRSPDWARNELAAEDAVALYGADTDDPVCPQEALDANRFAFSAVRSAGATPAWQITVWAPLGQA